MTSAKECSFSQQHCSETWKCFPWHERRQWELLASRGTARHASRKAEAEAEVRARIFGGRLRAENEARVEAIKNEARISLFEQRRELEAQARRFEGESQDAQNVVVQKWYNDEVAEMRRETHSVSERFEAFMNRKVREHEGKPKRIVKSLAR